MGDIGYTGSKDPSEWGPPLWSVLHGLPESAPSLDRLKACLGHLCLPCKACQDHYEQYIENRPPALIGSRTEAFDWIFDLHNEINARLGKPRVTREIYVAKRKADAVGAVILKDTFF